VTKIEKKRARRSLKARLKAWWWPIHPEERRRHQRQAALAAALVALLLLALIFVRVGTGGGSANRQNAGEAGDSYADR
jgi:Flp pilus assembly protein TadG